jgi:hypothetical protein
MWDVFMLLLVIYVCYMIPYEIGFGFTELPYYSYLDWSAAAAAAKNPLPPPSYPPTIPSPPRPPGPPPSPVPPAGAPYVSDVERMEISLRTWDWVVDAFFWCDLFSNFRVAYIDDTATMIRDGPKIATHYLSTWFLIDLLSCIPFDQIVMAAVSGLNASQSMAIMLLRTIRLLRLARLLRVLERMKKGGTVRMFKLLFFITLVVHWIACLWFLLYKMLRGQNDQVWSFDIQLPENTTMGTYYLQWWEWFRVFFRGYSQCDLMWWLMWCQFWYLCSDLLTHLELTISDGLFPLPFDPTATSTPTS